MHYLLLCMGLLAPLALNAASTELSSFQSCKAINPKTSGHTLLDLDECKCYPDGNNIIAIMCEKASPNNNNDTAGFLRDFKNDLEDPQNHDFLQDFLEEIIIRGYNFGSLPRNVIGLENYDEIITLDLTNNKITQISGQTFHHTFDLERLILDDNELVFDGSHPRMFSSINGMRVLSLRRALASANAQTSVQFLKDIFDESDLRDLEEVYMSENELVYVHGSTFQNLPELSVLDLSRNKIVNIDGLVSATCYDYDYSQNEYWNFQLKPQRCYLEVLNMSENAISTIPPSFLEELGKMPTFEELDITGNKLMCDCSLIPFLELLQQGPGFTITDQHKLICTGPDEWLDKTGRTITEGSLSGRKVSEEGVLLTLKRLCSEIDDLPKPQPSDDEGENSCLPEMEHYESCACIHFDKDVVILNCSNPNKMSRLQPLTKKVVKNVEEIIVQGQNISSLNLDDLLPVKSNITEFDFLYTLALPNNKITTFEIKSGQKGRGPFAAANDLERLILDDNDIMIKEDIIEFLQEDLKDLEFWSLRHALHPGSHVHLEKLFNIDSFNNLEFLNLEENEIEMISSENIFKALPELRELRLGNNKLSSVDNIVSDKCFDYYREYTDPNGVNPGTLNVVNVTCNLKTLSLKNNQIHTIPGEFLETLKKIKTFQYLDLRGNPLWCDAHIKPLWLALTNGTYIEDFTIWHDSLFCSDAASKLYGRPVISLTVEEVNRLEAGESFTHPPAVQHHKVASAIIGLVCVALLIVVLIAVYYNRKTVVRNVSRVCRNKNKEYRPVLAAAV